MTEEAAPIDSKNSTNPAPRCIWADLLRIFSILAVIGLHVCSGGFWQTEPVTSTDWIITNFAGCLTKWCVPVFVMVSGMFLLDPRKEVTIRSVLTKYLPRLAISFLVWSLIYACYTNWDALIQLRPEALKAILKSWITGHYHMWFLYMIAGLYLITPLLRKITEEVNKKLLRYFLLLWLIFSVLYTTIELLPHTGLLTGAIGSMGMSYVSGFVGYYLLGYYLTSEPPGRTVRCLIYAGAILGAAVTIVGSTLLSQRSGHVDRQLFGNLTLNVFLMAIGIFVYFQNVISKINWSADSQKRIQQLSGCTFGVYLSHALILSMFNKWGLTVGTMPVIFSIPLLILLVLLLSLTLTALLRKISWFRKYLT